MGTSSPEDLEDSIKSWRCNSSYLGVSFGLFFVFFATWVGGVGGVVEWYGMEWICRYEVRIDESDERWMMSMCLNNRRLESSDGCFGFRGG